VIVMVTLLFATFALLTFMEKASNDLMVEHREAQNRRLRVEAFSALETTLAVIEEFRTVGNGLHSPAEGWNNPLEFAAYVPSEEDRTIEVTFEDESGKISLPRANAVVLTNLFKNWQITQQDAELLADALMGWMQRTHVYTSPTPPDYEKGAIPYASPGRPLRSFHELAAIEKVREMFYDADGRPNEYWKRFADSVSLYDFARPNINGAKPDTLAALGLLDETQQRNVADYLTGAGNFLSQGPGYFQEVGQAQQVTGPSGDMTAFATTTSALRIILTVREGSSEFRISTVIAPPNGATTVQTNATAQRTEASVNTAQNSAQQQNRPNTAQNNKQPAPTNTRQTAAPRNLRYPFTLLEIRENAEIPPPVAPVPPPI
jgi:hypothetical protein